MGKGFFPLHNEIPKLTEIVLIKPNNPRTGHGHWFQPMCRANSPNLFLGPISALQLGLNWYTIAPHTFTQEPVCQKQCLAHGKH